jgi:hypothetical protein
MASVTASIVVQFGDEATAAAGYFLTAEIDSRPEGKNGGRTSFLPGQTAYFLVYASPELTVTGLATYTPTGGANPINLGSGAEPNGGDAYIEVEEFLTFANSSEANLSKLPDAQSNDLVITVVGSNGALGTRTVTGTKVYYPTPVTAVLKATYTTKARVWSLSSPQSMAGLTTFPIVAVMTGTAT